MEPGDLIHSEIGLQRRFVPKNRDAPTEWLNVHGTTGQTYRKFATAREAEQYAIKKMKAHNKPRAFGKWEYRIVLRSLNFLQEVA